MDLELTTEDERIIRQIKNFDLRAEPVFKQLESEAEEEEAAEESEIKNARSALKVVKFFDYATAMVGPNGLNESMIHQLILCLDSTGKVFILEGNDDDSKYTYFSSMDIPQIVDAAGTSSNFEILNAALISTSKIALLVKIIKRQPNSRKEQASVEYKMQIWDLKKTSGLGEMSMLITFNVPEKAILEIASSFKQSFVFDSHKNEFYFPDFNPRGALLVNKISIVNSHLTGKGISAASTNVETLNLTMNHVLDIVGQHISLGKKSKGSLY